MRTPVSRMLFTYWNEIRGQRLAPKRFEIEPSRIAGILPDTFILERIDAATTRFRLAGTRISEAFGVEFRGINIYDLFDEQDRLTLQRQLSVMARQGAVADFVLSASTADGRTATFEFIALPLTHTRDIVDRFVGVMVPINAPKWLGHDRLVDMAITTDALIWPDGRPHALIDQARRQTPFAPQVREARIVRSDRRQFRVYDGGLNTSSDS